MLLPPNPCLLPSRHENTSGGGSDLSLCSGSPLGPLHPQLQLPAGLHLPSTHTHTASSSLLSFFTPPTTLRTSAVMQPGAQLLIHSYFKMSTYQKRKERKKKNRKTSIPRLCLTNFSFTAVTQISGGQKTVPSLSSSFLFFVVVVALCLCASLSPLTSLCAPPPSASSSLLARREIKDK